MPLAQDAVPRTLSVFQWTSRVVSVATAASVIAACGGGDGGPTGNGGNGGGGGGGGGATAGFTLSASGTALSVARGASGTVTVTVARTGSFTGPVSLQPTNIPPGVTALFSAPSVASGATTSTLTISPSATAALATSTISIVANGAGVANQTLAIQLTVSAGAQAGPFAMALSVSSYLALPPTNLSVLPTLTITRNAGFTGSVALSVSGVPPGLVVAPTPNVVTGTTTKLGIINGGAANGVYQVTIRGVASGLGEQSITLPVTVAPPSTGSIQWQFCENGARGPQWLVAVKDGAGPWTRIVPNGSTYAFNATSAAVQLALVTPDDAGYRTTVYQSTAQEMAARAASECALFAGASTRTVTGSVTGVTASDLTLTSMGWWNSSLVGAGTYTLLNLPAGSLDLFAVRGTANSQGDLVLNRLIVRRGMNPPPGSANAVLDFNALEAVAPITATWTFGNITNEAFGVTQHFLTAGGTVGLLHAVPAVDKPSTTRTLYGVPAAQAVAGDLYQVIATVGTLGPPRATRQVVTYTRTLANRSVNFGPALPAPTVGVVAGAPVRLRAQGTLPAEYNSGVSVDISQPGVPAFATVHATRGFLGAGSSFDVQLPDLTAVLGWDSNFSLRSGTATSWWVSGGGPTLDMLDSRYLFATTRARWTGALTGITPPADGATYLFARATGTITP